MELYSGGKVTFHFNYFEDNSWETAMFDADKTYFRSGKIGGQEFCDVVTAVHFLYEMYDDGPGFAEINGEIVNERGYVGWINHLLGTGFSMKKRFRLWDNLEAYALERVGEYEDPTERELMDLIPAGWHGVSGRRNRAQRPDVYHPWHRDADRDGDRSRYLSGGCLWL